MRNYYLKQLGIEQWVMRNKASISSPDQPKDMQALIQSVATCTRCALHQTRTQTVFARGNPQAKLMVVGEAPGFYEDKQGLPFVGKAGSLLNQMLKSIDLSDEDVFIANVLKCRPPENRDPQREEIDACAEHLKRQIELVDPQLILGVGRFAGQFLLNALIPLNKMRKEMHYYQGKPVIISYHPAYLLRKPQDKKKAYLDLLLIKKIIDSH